MLTDLGVDHDAILNPEDIEWKEIHGEDANLQYTRANDMADNAYAALKTVGSGVVEVNGYEAYLLANRGKAVIAAYRNYDTDDDGEYLSGHVALVIPDSNEYNENTGPRIAQAGIRNFSPSDNAYVITGFTESLWAQGQVKFYVLDND